LTEIGVLEAPVGIEGMVDGRFVEQADLRR
jgi:hypothetical protein